MSQGGTLGISGWGCAARTLEPLAYTRASFSWILLPCTRVNSPKHSYPRVAVFQKLRSLAQAKAKPKQSLIYTTIASLLKKDLFILHQVFFPLSPKFQVNLIEFIKNCHECCFLGATTKKLDFLNNLYRYNRNNNVFYIKTLKVLYYNGATFSFQIFNTTFIHKHRRTSLQDNSESELATLYFTTDFR